MKGKHRRSQKARQQQPRNQNQNSEEVMGRELNRKPYESNPEELLESAINSEVKPENVEEREHLEESVAKTESIVTPEPVAHVEAGTESESTEKLEPGEGAEASAESGEQARNPD